MRWRIDGLCMPACLVVAVLSTTISDASIVRHYTDRELVAASDAVLIGTVQRMTPRLGPDGRSISTDMEILVGLPLKGCRQGETVRLTMPGGRIGDVTQWVSGTPGFRLGEDVLLHAQTTPGGTLSVTGFAQGKTAIQCGRLNGSGEPVDLALGRVRAHLGPAAVTTDSLTVNMPNVFPGDTASATGPSVTGISPSSAPGNTGAVVTISGSGFGSNEGTVAFPYAGSANAADIVSWSDAEVRCRVPLAESGAVVVTTAALQSADPYPYAITFSYLGFKLPDTALPDTCAYQIGGTPDAANEFAELDAALQTWNDVTACDASVGRLVDVSLAPLQYDNDQVLGWINSGWTLPSGVAAVCYNWYVSGEIAHHDIAFNGEYINWSETGAPGCIDIRSAAIHELGHWWGLADLYGAADNQKTMYGITYYGDTRQASLDAADIEGVQWLHPGDATPSEPVWDWAGTTGHSKDGVDPGTGTPNTTRFEFAAKLATPDGVAPATLKVQVGRLQDCRKWKVIKSVRLRPDTDDWSAGVICRASMPLPNGVYQYRFFARDAYGQVATGSPAIWRRGPVMEAGPQLWCTGLKGRTDDFVYPNTGTADVTKFRFGVQYTDSQGDDDALAKVVIQRRRDDDTWATYRSAGLTSISGTPKTGEFLTYGRRLPPGDYRYRFRVRDAADTLATGADSAGGDAADWRYDITVTGDGATSVASAGRITSLAAVSTGAGIEATYSLTGAASVSARVMNLAGRPVRTLCTERVCSSGASRLVWTAVNDAGTRVPSGVYLVEVTARADDGTQSRAITQAHVRR